MVKRTGIIRAIYKTAQAGVPVLRERGLRNHGAGNKKSAGACGSHVRIQIYRAPIAANNRGANLRGGLSLLRKLVAEHRFLLANIAF